VSVGLWHHGERSKQWIAEYEESVSVSMSELEGSKLECLSAFSQ
jgi:hypothetical protein